MIFDDREKCLRLAKKILQQYRRTLGESCTLKLLQQSENITYFVESPLRRAVLRLSRPAYHTEEELRAEAEWMLRLGEDFSKGFFCGRFDLRQPIAGDDGRYLYAAVDEAGDGCYGMAFTYLSGTPLEELPLEQQIPWFEKLGEAAALFHCQAGAWDRAKHLPRLRWNYETMIGRSAVWGDWREAFSGSGFMGADGGENAVSQKDAGEILARADRRIAEKLQAYGVKAENYGLIHGDLRGANVLTEKDRLKIIDFDDCGYGWYMQDLAACVSFIETEPAVSGLIAAWLKGYGRQRKLSAKDIDMTDTFIMMRRMQLMAWVNSRANAASAIAYRDGFIQGTVSLAARYIGC